MIVTHTRINLVHVFGPNPLELQPPLSSLLNNVQDAVTVCEDIPVDPVDTTVLLIGKHSVLLGQLDWLLTAMGCTVLLLLSIPETLFVSGSVCDRDTAIIQNHAAHNILQLTVGSISFCKLFFALRFIFIQRSPVIIHIHLFKIIHLQHAEL